MSATMRLAAPADVQRLIRLMETCHDEMGLKIDPDTRSQSVTTLLSGDVPGAAYLIGPPSSPVGYIVLRFGFSVVAGGMVAQIDELFVRPAIRRRGVASEAVQSTARTLRGGGIATLQAELPEGAPEGLFRRLLFKGDMRSVLSLAL